MESLDLPWKRFGSRKTTRVSVQINPVETLAQSVNKFINEVKAISCPQTPATTITPKEIHNLDDIQDKDIQFRDISRSKRKKYS